MLGGQKGKVFKEKKESVEATTINSNKVSLTIDGSDGGTAKPVLSSSPLELKTKAGKLIVSAVEDLQKDANNNITIDPLIEKSLEINTKKGKLLIVATSKDKSLENIVLTKEIPADGQADANAKTLPEAPTKIPAAKPRRERVDFSRSSLERNFITPARAMSDFLLKLSDLESLPKTKRRSPYEQEPPIVVYWRKDVEAKAIEKWGSRENLLRECLKREIEKKRYQQSTSFAFDLPKTLYSFEAFQIYSR